MMEQLYRREFLIKVLFTLGLTNLLDLTGLETEQLEYMSLGVLHISDCQLEKIYNALKVAV